MSQEYDNYLHEHITSVQIGFSWIEKNLPELLPLNYSYENLLVHDDSKRSSAEYDAYDQYFYGKTSDNEEKSLIKEAFDIAWLHHIHANPHHWQYWVLFEDDGDVNKPKPLKMPYKYIIEMICDWWSFSWRKGNLYEVFDWYEDHKNKMILHEDVRKKVEDILDKIRKKLNECDKIEEFDGESDEKETEINEKSAIKTSPIIEDKIVGINSNT